MFRLYVLTALRKLVREKFYGLICIFSLSVGFASIFVISLYLYSELTYDQHNVNHEQIYRLHYSEFNGGGGLATIGGGFGPLLANDYPQLGEYVRFTPALEPTLRYEENSQELNIWLADQNVFDIFSHDVIYGDTESALTNPSSIAISQSIAESYFGSEDPIGRILISNNFNYEVTLVFADLPDNTHFKYDALLPFSVREKMMPRLSGARGAILDLISHLTYTYFKVEEGFDPSSISQISERFYQDHFGENFPIAANPFELGLQPLASIHLGKNLLNDLPGGNIFYLYSLAAIGLFIMLAASINHMNLATARATKRNKDIGMRKILGANRSQLVTQLLGESLAFAMAALGAGILFAVCMVELGITDSLISKEEALINAANPLFVMSILIAGGAIGLVSGIYPAFYLSSGLPLRLLGDSKGSWRSGHKLRHYLVLLQLMIAIGVICCTLLITKQLQYVTNKPLGFEKENRVAIRLQGTDIISQIPAIRNELSNHVDILNVTSSQEMPGGNSAALIRGNVDTNEGDKGEVFYASVVVGSNFISTMGIELIAGRDFLQEQGRELPPLIVNESMVALMNWDEPIGKEFSRADSSGIAGTVIGVVRDFHYAPLHFPISPMLLRSRPMFASILIVNISDADVGASLDLIGEVLKQFDPDLIYTPFFLDDSLNQLYEKEFNVTKLAAIFATICVLISLVGLFGLATYITEQRTKEIGIRKVMGASDSNIIAMFSESLLIRLIIAAVPASILSLYVARNWMESFAYKAELGLLPFIAAIGIVSCLSLATVVLQALKIARVNPVETLRYE
ncbi:MAG: ABC transporter permease [Pseudohongiella sp.]|nr:ABC transporter permease [Pseudohongiella sp.]